MMDDQSEINVDVKFWWRLHRLSCALARVIEVKHIIEILSRLLDSSLYSHNINVDNRHNERNVVWFDLFIKQNQQIIISASYNFPQRENLTMRIIHAAPESENQWHKHLRTGNHK